MSLSILNIASPQVQAPRDTAHRGLLFTLGASSVIGTLFLLVFGLDYYLTSFEERPYHPQHTILRPSGSVGLWLGVFGVSLFFLLFLYALRKKWTWLANQGNSRHWFNYHVLMGVTAPVVIAFHAAFRFRGIAGIAFWTMLVVAASGIVGRYIYGQIPRGRNAAELSLQESTQLQQRLMARLGAQRLVPLVELARLFQLPSPKYVANESLIRMLCTLLWIDCKRPFRVARVRRHGLKVFGKITTLGGWLPSRNLALEDTIEVARQRAAISKKLLFLGKSQKVFQLWHVAHRPFSYSFAVLAIIHIVVSLLFR